MTFTSLMGEDIERELRDDGVERIEIIEGFYGGRMHIQATLDHGEWDILVEWNDGFSTDFVLVHPAPGLS